MPWGEVVPPACNPSLPRSSCKSTRFSASASFSVVYFFCACVLPCTLGWSSSILNDDRQDYLRRLGSFGAFHTGFEADLLVRRLERNYIFNLFVCYHIRERGPGFILAASKLDVVHSYLEGHNSLVSIIYCGRQARSGIDSYRQATLDEDP